MDYTIFAYKNKESYDPTEAKEVLDFGPVWFDGERGDGVGVRRLPVAACAQRIGAREQDAPVRLFGFKIGRDDFIVELARTLVITVDPVEIGHRNGDVAAAGRSKRLIGGHQRFTRVIDAIEQPSLLDQGFGAPGRCCLYLAQDFDGVFSAFLLTEGVSEGEPRGRKFGVETQGKRIA